MTKLTKEEFIAKINEKLSDNPELAVELMEDVTDSFEVDNSLAEEWERKYNDAITRYKERFLSGEEMSKVESTETKEEEETEVKEDEVIDVQEIFEEDEKKEDEE